MFERDKEVLRECLGSNADEAKLYGVRYDCSTAYILAMYSSNPTDIQYETYVLTPSSRMLNDLIHHFGHPKYNGITKRNNWSIDPQYLK